MKRGPPPPSSSSSSSSSIVLNKKKTPSAAAVQSHKMCPHGFYGFSLQHHGGCNAMSITDPLSLSVVFMDAGSWTMVLPLARPDVRSRWEKHNVSRATLYRRCTSELWTWTRCTWMGSRKPTVIPGLAHRYSHRVPLAVSVSSSCCHQRFGQKSPYLCSVDRDLLCSSSSSLQKVFLPSTSRVMFSSTLSSPN
jgi:hypothetical protein